MKLDIPFILIEKYIDGTCSQEEINYIQKWYASFEKEDDYISTLSNKEQDLLGQIIYSKIFDSIKEKDNFKTHTLYNRRNNFRWTAVAAAVVLLTISLIFIFRGNKIFKNDKRNYAQLFSQTDHLIKVENNSKKLMKAVLPDSSSVWLFPDSKINYAINFIKKERRVKMSGECFFDVSKDASHPFVIYSKHLITRVWGTSFRVTDLSNGNSAQVAVVTGKVSVRTKPVHFKNGELKQPSADIMLKADEKVIFDEGHEKLMKYTNITHKEADDLKMWVHTKLKFDNESLPTIVKELNERFNVNITLEDEILNEYRLNANFSDFNLPEILEAMSKSLNVTYTITNKTDIVLKPSINN